MDSLYENDYEKWIEKQKQFLLNKDIDKLDIENLIEELEDMGESQYNSLTSHLEILLAHLLKYNYQKTVLKDDWVEDRVIYTWLPSIVRSRSKIERILKKKPSLKSRLDEAFNEAYIDAKELAIKEMNSYSRADIQKLNDKSFPDINPWSFDQIMDEDWLPEDII